MDGERDAIVVQDAAGARDGGRQPQVLVVEANPYLLQAVVAALRQAGLQVRACTTITAAREACQAAHFDLLVIGWLIERTFADELLAMLQTTIRPDPLPPVGVLSGMGEAATRACLRPGAPIDTVLSRPVDPMEVSNWVDRQLKRHETCVRL